MIEFVHDFNDGDAWDAFVENHPEGRFCQLFGYTCLERVYGYRPRYTAFTRDGAVVGVLPAFEARSLFFGRRLVSQPFSEYGGFLLAPDLSADDRRAIFDGVAGFIADNGFSALETHGNYGAGPDAAGFAHANPQQLAYLDLDRPEDELWSKVISRHVRKAVRKAEREGLTTVMAADEATIEGDFYPLYVQSMTRLGSPPHALAYFLECRRSLAGKMQIFWAVKDGRKIAGLLGFACGQRVSIVNIVSDERHWHLRPNDLIHWEFIRWALSTGFRQFDFGSVRYEGQSQFKRKWGCAIKDSGYYFLAARGAQAPAATFDSSSGTMAAAGKLWAKCMPNAAARLVGPFLRKNLIR